MAIAKDVSNTIDRAKTYYKFTGENYNAANYELGPNEIREHFNDNERSECGPGAIYFSDVEHIFAFLNYGDKLCEISIPKEARVMSINNGNKYRADKIFITKIYHLDSPQKYLKAFKHLIKNGARVDTIHALRWASFNGYSEIVKLLIELGANVQASDNYALRWALYNNHIKTAQILVRTGGADIETYKRWIKRWYATQCNYSEKDINDMLSRADFIL